MAVGGFLHFGIRQRKREIEEGKPISTCPGLSAATEPQLTNRCPQLYLGIPFPRHISPHQSLELLPALCVVYIFVLAPACPLSVGVRVHTL